MGKATLYIFNPQLGKAVLGSFKIDPEDNIAVIENYILNLSQIHSIFNINFCDTTFSVQIYIEVYYKAG